MIKVAVFEVLVNLKDPEIFVIKSEMIDLDDTVPSTAKKYVMLEFEEYEKLTGEKIKIKMKPKRKRSK